MRAPAAAAAFVAAFAATFGSGRAGSVDVENGVLILDDSNFDTAVKKFQFLMVDFYAPWCGHCKELMPSYEKAAKSLKKREPPLRLAKVDATSESGGALAKKFDVDSYPTVIAFKDGEKHSVFDAGGKEKQEIIQYMEALAGNPSLFNVRVAYMSVRSIWKKSLRNVPFLGGTVRKLLYWGFPGIIGMCLFLPLCCCFCCRGESDVPPPAAKGKPTSEDDPKVEGESEKAADKKED